MSKSLFHSCSCAWSMCLYVMLRQQQGQKLYKDLTACAFLTKADLVMETVVRKHLGMALSCSPPGRRLITLNYFHHGQAVVSPYGNGYLNLYTYLPFLPLLILPGCFLFTLRYVKNINICPENEFYGEKTICSNGPLLMTFTGRIM